MADTASRWYKIDNAAKIVPSTAVGTDTRVFRLTCELYEDVDERTLQKALDLAIPEFPYFGSVLRKGVFWYYLEASRTPAIVHIENKPPCSAIYHESRRNLLYRVVYYKKRINLEMFHVLTDGTGAFEFLKQIVTNYLKIRHELDDDLALPERASVQGRNDDAFQKFYEKQSGKPKESRITPKKAYHIKGERDENLQCHLLEGTVSTSAFLKKAKEHNSTMAVFTTALYIEALLQEMSVRDRKLPIVLSIPVNLRNYFHSDTARNFFGVINVAFYPEQYDGSLDSIITVVNESFKRQLAGDQVSLTMNNFAALEHNLFIKIVPLALKNLVISIANARAQRGITGTVSNVGKVTMPEPLVPYIHKFSCFMAAPDAQISISSFGDALCFGIATAFSEHAVMMNFFRRIREMGIDVELATSDYNKDIEDEEA